MDGKGRKEGEKTGKTANLLFSL